MLPIFHGVGNEGLVKSVKYLTNSSLLQCIDSFSKENYDVSADLYVTKKNLKNGDNVQNASLNGRWSKDEHERFLQGLELYGRSWKKIKKIVGTRSATQIRSHAQKFFAREGNSSNENISDEKHELYQEESIIQKSLDLTSFESPLKRPSPPPNPKISGIKEELVQGDGYLQPALKQKKLEENILCTGPEMYPRFKFEYKPYYSRNFFSQPIAQEIIKISNIAVQEPFADPEFENFMLEKEKTCEVPIIQLNLERNNPGKGCETSKFS
jgi:SHAQKYF class myb-like DNA-binding protein